MTTVLFAILPVVGVVVGAILQHWLSRTAEDRKQLGALRREAYVDYLRAVTKVARAKDPDAAWEARTALVDAKARIAIYGRTEVVAALARFEETGAILRDDDSRKAFVALASEMRETETARSDDLRLVLLGPHLVETPPNQALRLPGDLPNSGQ